MGSAVLVAGRFADVQELVFKTEKSSDIGCAELLGCLFLYCQEWRFLAAKRSKIAVQTLKGVDLLMPKNCVFRLRNVQKCAFPS